METKFRVNTTFRVGQKVRVKHDLGYFSPSIHGRAMTVLDVERTTDDKGREITVYHTDMPDPVLQTPFNEFELVGLES